MNNEKLVFYAENEKLRPFKKHYTDAGWDLRTKEDVELMPHDKPTVLKTGVKSKIPAGLVGIVKDRSGLGVAGLSVRAGVIDSEYRGEIGVVVQNTTDKIMRLREGDRIAQIIVMPCLLEAVVTFDEYEIDNTERGEKGFGSSGNE